jgi:hypothetical protein
MEYYVYGNEFENIRFDGNRVCVDNDDMFDEFDEDIINDEEEYEKWLEEEYTNIYSDLHNWDYYRFLSYRHRPDTWNTDWSENNEYFEEYFPKDKWSFHSTFDNNDILYYENKIYSNI